MLHRIEKEFDIKIESKQQQFDWSEKIKNPGDSKKSSKPLSHSEANLPIKKLSSFNMRID